MNQRRLKIVDCVNNEGQVTFARLKAEFPDTSEMTLRTDLKALDEAGQLVRIHGGAKSVGAVTGSDGALALRVIRNQEKKTLIAQKAAALIRPGMSVFIDSGSTATVLARHIPDGAYQIFTCGITCATELARLAQASVHIIGGQLNRDSLSIAGTRGILAAQASYYDLCFIGVTSYSPKHGFCCEAPDDCALKQVVIRQSKKTVVLMDSSKFGHTNTHLICNLRDVSTLVCDDALTEEQRAWFLSQNVNLI